MWGKKKKKKVPEGAAQNPINWLIRSEDYKFDNEKKTYFSLFTYLGV